MNSVPALLETLRVLIRSLDAMQACYMLVGGVALAAWARPRATTDIDLVIAVEEEDLPTLGRLLARRAGGLSSMRPFTFRNGTVLRRVVIQRPEGEVVVDLILAREPFLTAALARRQHRQLGEIGTYVVSAEDLVLMKLQAGKPQDLIDVREVAAAQPLNMPYIRRWAARLRLKTRLSRALPWTRKR